jgi:hypothetical protein
MAEEFGPLFSVVFRQPPADSRLADLGLIDVAELRAAYGLYLKSQEHILGVNLYLTLQAELWLRSQQ